jgi:hypothetical protein
MQSITSLSERAVSEKIAKFWLQHLFACEDLESHLDYIDLSAKRMRTEALRLEFQAFDDALVADVPEGWRFKEYRRRTIITLAGEITYLRRIYVEPSGICHALLDEVLGIRTRFKLAPDAFLWIVRVAADVSYRKAAKAFYERTGAKVSHWLVMAALHEEGRLLLEAACNAAFNKQKTTGLSVPLISQDILYVEFDGIHIPLQKPVHSPRQPRWKYERDRFRQSFELKSAVAYAGKDEKGCRGGVVHFSLDAQPTYFWPMLSAKIGSVYDLRDVAQMHSAADAAGWCKNMSLDIGLAAKDCVHHLDRFHINREIRRAFGGRTAQATHFISLASSKRIKRLMRDLQLVIDHVADKGRYLALHSYLISNMELIKKGPGPSMGTMEGTNAHVYAARMKVWGGAWSRTGAAAMAAVRAQIASGLPLIAPKPDNTLYDDSQIRKKMRYEERLLEQTHERTDSSGRGYEPPQGSIVLSTHMSAHLFGVLNYST